MFQYRETHFGKAEIQGDTFRKSGNTGGHIWEMLQYRGTQLGNVAIQGDTFRQRGITGRRISEIPNIISLVRRKIRMCLPLS